MGLIIAFIVVEIALIMFFAPIKVGIKGYFSLSKTCAGVDLTLYNLTLIRIRIFDEGGEIGLKVNDKGIDVNKLRDKTTYAKQPKIVLKLFKSLRNGEIIINGNILAVLGDNDPKNSAIIFGIVSGILAMAGIKASIYSDFDKQRADADFVFGTNISLIQAFEALA